MSYFGKYDRKNDIRNGLGVYYWDSKNRYEGEFKNDNIEYMGKTFYDNSDIL